MTSLLQLPHHKQSELTWLYISSVLRTFVAGFAFSLLPIVLYETNSQDTIKDTLIFVASLYLITHTVRLFVNPLIFNICSTFGLKWGLTLGQVSLTIVCILLKNNALIPAFITLGFAIGFWWDAYHLYFGTKVKDSSIGKNLGTLGALSLMTGMLTPLISGLVLTIESYDTYWNISILLSLVSIVPTFFLTGNKPLSHVSFTDIYRESKNHTRDFFMFFGLSAESVTSRIIWPLALAFILDDYLSLGIFFTLVSLGAIIIYLLLGRYIDSHPKKTMERIGVGAVTTSWFGKVFVQNPIGFYIFEMIHSLGHPLFDMPANAIGYEHAHRETASIYIAFRQTAIQIAEIATLLIFILVISIDAPISVMFILAAFVATLPLIHSKYPVHS